MPPTQSHPALGKEDAEAGMLSTQELDLLSRLLDEEGIEPAQPVPIPRASDLSQIPLSFGQERLWFLDQLEPGSPLRKITRAYQLIGQLNVPALEVSVGELVRRHEALRTTFSTAGGQPVQNIMPFQPFSLPILDLRELPEGSARSEAMRVVEEEYQRFFDLSQGPLLRVSLLRLEDQEHVLLISIHHIVTDGWSMRIFHKELCALYNAFSAGNPSPLPELPIQYADYALWQREWLQGEVLDRQLHYWTQKLEGAPPNLELPADRPRPAVQTYGGRRESFVLSEQTTQALKALSRTEGATPFMTLLAAFKLLLSRLTGQQDIVVGTPIAGRNRPETEGLIGFFLNFLVLRTDVSGELTFLQLLRRVRETALAAYDHQEIPFEKLLEELQPERDLSRTPLFQVFFNMVPLEEASWDLRGVSVTRIPTEGVHSNFDLTIYVSDEGKAIRLNLVLNADLFSQVRMAEMLRQYQHLLAQIASNPERRLLEYSLVAPEAAGVLPDPTLPLSEKWQCAIQARFAEHARSAPDQPAVLDARTRWTYGELDLWSNRLANYLRLTGIQSQDIVAIYGHRSAALVWAILGVLKAGAAFLILDPAYPPTRLIAYLRAAQPRGWINLHAGNVPEPIQAFLDTSGIECQVLVPGQATGPSQVPLGSQPDHTPDLVVGPDDLACVAFTSGSSGTPKGILGRHGPLTHFLPWQQETFGLSPADRFTMLSGLSHDPLQRDIFTALWVGATLCVPDDDTIGTPGRLAEWMAREKISFSHLTPAMSQILTETAAPDCRLPSLRYAFFVGDELKHVDVERLAILAPSVTCINSYGSTETQRAVGYYPIPPQSRDHWTRAVYPLGSGIPDVQLLLLNAERGLAGVGELAEIHVRSPHLARGYLGDEVLTQERFLSNPFTNRAGDRLYRTGDLGRYLPDGTVEFAGRSDQQAKIRGFRIEPGEIEASLQQHDRIQDAVVLAREDEPGQKRLVAYVVPAEGSALSGANLRSFLSKRLPDYMVPAAFVVLDALPLTPNQKLDRSALPAPDWSSLKSTDAFAAPRTAVEESLAAIWADVLSVERVGIHDNFFERGGHSLLGVRLFARIDTELGVDLPLAELFQAPSIAELARVIQGDKGSLTGSWSPLVTMQPAGTRPPLFVVPGNVGNVYADLGDLAQHLGPDQPFYGLQDGPQNPIRIEAIAARYLEEIGRVQEEGPYLLAGVCSGAVIAFEMAQQLHAQGERVSLLAMVEPSLPQRPGLRTDLRFLTHVFRRFGRRMGHHARRLVQLSSSHQGQYTRLKLKVVANRWALRKYSPRMYAGSVDIFLTEASLRNVGNPQAAWRQFAADGAKVHEIPGSHATIVGLDDTPIDAAHMRVLAEKMNACIDTALAGQALDDQAQDNQRA